MLVVLVVVLVVVADTVVVGRTEGLVRTEVADPAQAVAVGIAVSQGGGGFLFGGGSPTRHILPDVYPEERILPEELKNRYEQAQKDKKVPKELMDEIDKCPPAGNIWELNSKFGWKERGWGTNYFPGISAYGAIIHTKWSGFICNLYNKRSLSLLDFTGYALKGTSDLFIVWKKFYQQGMKPVILVLVWNQLKISPMK